LLLHLVSRLSFNVNRTRPFGCLGCLT